MLCHSRKPTPWAGRKQRGASNVRPKGPAVQATNAMHTNTVIGKTTATLASMVKACLGTLSDPLSPEPSSLCRIAFHRNLTLRIATKPTHYESMEDGSPTHAETGP